MEATPGTTETTTATTTHSSSSTATSPPPPLVNTTEGEADGRIDSLESSVNGEDSTNNSLNLETALVEESALAGEEQEGHKDKNNVAMLESSGNRDNTLANENENENGSNGRIDTEDTEGESISRNDENHMETDNKENTNEDNEETNEDTSGKTDSTPTIKARQWEKRWVKVGHLQVYRWTPVDPRGEYERQRLLNQKARYNDNAPITRSITAAYKKHTVGEIKRRSTRHALRNNEAQLFDDLSLEGDISGFSSPPPLSTRTNTSTVLASGSNGDLTSNSHIIMTSVSVDSATSSSKHPATSTTNGNANKKARLRGEEEETVEEILVEEDRGDDEDDDEDDD